MTREEATERLKTDIYKYADFTENPNEDEFWEAFDMAIKALEQEPCDDWYGVPSNEMILERARQASKDLRKRFKEDLEQEPCEDCISRKSIKQKLQEHHDFFVNAYGGFCNLPQNDKARVDEITNFIAMVVNEPSVKPQINTGHWIDINSKSYEIHRVYKCSECGTTEIEYPESIYRRCRYCPNCGARMIDEQESEDKE